MALNKMVKVGDRIRDPQGREWTITDTLRGLAWYDRKTNYIVDDPTSKQVDSIFIARFDENGKGVFTYNKNMTLVE